MNKQDKAQFLFEEMGGIDEEILAECGERFPSKRREKRIAFRIIAATVAVFSVLLLSVSGVAMAGVVSLIGALGNADQVPDGTVFPTGSEADSKPADAVEEPTVMGDFFTTESLFDGTPHLIYLDAEKELRTVKLSVSDYKAIQKHSASPKRKVTAEDCPASPVWVSDGHGTVFTPYLIMSAGTVCYGNVFDYQDEVVPNDSLTALLDTLLP